MVRINLATIQKAIARAKRCSTDWQAELCEIMLIPAVGAIWRKLNPNRRGLRLERIKGERYADADNREANLARGQAKAWAAVAGYVLVLMEWPDGAGAGRSIWNAVRADYYGHSASTAWDGIRRETYGSGIAEAMRMIASGYRHPTHDADLAKWGIEIIEEMAEAAA